MGKLAFLESLAERAVDAVQGSDASGAAKQQGHFRSLERSGGIGREARTSPE
jgi:hypothetical protein